MSRESHRPTNPPTPPSDLALDRYLAAECAPDERAAIARWLRGHRADAWTVEAIRSSVKVMDRGAGPDAASAVDGLLRRLGLTRVTHGSACPAVDGEGAGRPLSLTRHRIVGTTSLQWVGRPGAMGGRWRASVALVAVTLAVIAYGILATPRAAAVPARTYATRIGQRATIRLADGTRVTLAPQTTMTVRAGFGATHRDVRLTGQAYFDVTSVAGRPFTVRAGDVTSRVLGTTFVVRHYADEREVVVAVRSGKVAAGRHNPVVLTNNMLASITDSTTLVTTRTDLRDYMEWRDGHLVFSGATAAEVTAVLGHWYGLTFRFADAVMPNQALSGMFDDHDPQQEVLQNLRILLGARMVFDGNVVTIVPKRTSAVRGPRLDPMQNQNPIPTEVGR